MQQDCYDRLAAITDGSDEEINDDMRGPLGTTSIISKYFEADQQIHRSTRLGLIRSNTLFSVRMNVFLRPPSLRHRATGVSKVECFGVRDKCHLRSGAVHSPLHLRLNRLSSSTTISLLQRPKPRTPKNIESKRGGI